MEVSHTSLNWNIQTKRINIINYTFIIGITYNLQGDIRASLSTYMHHISTLHAYITMAVTFIAILFFHSDCHCQVQLKSTIESSEQIDWCMVKFQGKVLIIAHIKFRIYKIWLYQNDMCSQSFNTWHVLCRGRGGEGCPFLFVFINTRFLLSVHCPIPLIDPCWETGTQWMELPVNLIHPQTHVKPQ